ncbi:hypothetical protein KAI92_00710 [Candidatus Parcubacteria bacterium]|nr:hypothetical protein [Candidatus Parcubacteria bacterium]
MNIKILVLSLVLFFIPLQAFGAEWIVGVVSCDVWDVEQPATTGYAGAETSCSNLGGRVPTFSELNEVYNNKSSIGTFSNWVFVSSTVLSDPPTIRKAVYFLNGSEQSAPDTDNSPVVCVRNSTAPSAIGTYSGFDVSGTMTAEVVAMLLGYFPAIVGIFAVLFVLWLIRKLILSYTIGSTLEKRFWKENKR